MDEQAIDALARLVQAVDTLAQTMGPGWFLLWTTALAAIFLGIPAWRIWQSGRRNDVVVEAKELEIERLARDNRELRTMLLKNFGAEPPLLERDSTDSKSAASQRDKSKKRRR